MYVTEAGFENGRQMAHDRAHLRPFLVSADLNLLGFLLDGVNWLTN